MMPSNAKSAVFRPPDAKAHQGGGLMQAHAAWLQMMERFQRRGLYLAIALHLAIPIALAAPSLWQNLVSDRDQSASETSHHRLLQADEAALQAAEAAESPDPADKGRSLLRLVFQPPPQSPPLPAPELPAAPEPIPEPEPPLAAGPSPASEAMPTTEPAPAVVQSPDQAPEQTSQAGSAEALLDPPIKIAKTEVPEPSPAIEQVPVQAEKSPTQDPQNPQPPPVSQARQAALEAELKALSARIEAYQRQQEKEQAESVSPNQVPGEGSWPPDTAPAVKPPPETASRESIIQSRLPVSLKPFRGSWNYKMYYGERNDDSVVALVRLEVELEQDLYVLRSFAKPQGFAAALFQGEFTQESRGRVSAWGFRPEYYEEQRGQRGKRWAKMDWDQREVILSDGGRVPIAQAVQDRLSIAWQLSALAKSQLARLQSPAGIQIPLILTRHVELNRFFGRAIVEENLEGREVRLLKVEREPRPGKRDARIEVWLDVDRDMLPVRLRIEDRRGRVVEQVMQKD